MFCISKNCRRIICLLLCCLLLSFYFLPLKAHAVVGLSSTAAYAIEALLSVWGINYFTGTDVVSQGTQAINDLLTEFDFTQEQLALFAAVPVITAKGVIKVSKDFANGVRLLAEKIIDKIGSDSGSASFPSTSEGMLGNYKVLYVPFSLSARHTLSSGVNALNFTIRDGGTSPIYVYFYIDNGKTYYYALSDHYFKLGAHFNDGYGGTVLTSTYYQSFYYALGNTEKQVTLFDIPINPKLSVAQVYDLYNGHGVSISPSIPGSLVATSSAVPSEIYADQFVAVSGATYEDSDDMVTFWAGATADAATITDIPAAATFTDEYTAEAYVQDAAAVEEAEDLPLDLDPEPGFTGVFPFCIPFDIYNFLKVFQHTRSAPVVTLPLAFPDYIGGTQELTIDLSVFDRVASAVRTLELIAFCVGLAYVTSRLIKW